MLRKISTLCLLLVMLLNFSTAATALDLKLVNMEGGDDEVETFKKVDEGETIRFDVVKLNGGNGVYPINAIHLPPGSIFDGSSFTWTPSDEQSGMYEVSFYTFDPNVSDDVFETIRILVTDTSFTIQSGKLFERLFTAFDADGDKVEITINGLPEGATFTGSQFNPKLFRWTPDRRQTGRYAMTITATDYPPQGLEPKQDTSVLTIRVVKGNPNSGKRTDEDFSFNHTVANLCCFADEWLEAEG